MTKAKPPAEGGNMTYDQKSQILQHFRILKGKNDNAKYTTLANWAKAEFNLPKSSSTATISRIFQNQHKFDTLTSQDKSIKRTRIVTNEVLEESLAL